MPGMERLLAPALIGTWVNSMAYMLELLLVWQYFKNWRFRSRGADTTFVRCIVVLQLLADTLGTIFSAAAVYLVLVQHWGDIAFVARNPWPLAAYTIATGLSGFFEQLYLIRRYGILSEKYVVCLMLVLCATTALGGAIGVSVLSLIHASVTERKKIIPAALLWYITAATTDVAIATALVVQLRQFKSSFKRTQHAVRRLMFSAIQTGSVTAFVTTCALIGFAAWPETAVTLAFSFFLGRVYGCTLLYNLVWRRNGKGSDMMDSDDDEAELESASRSGSPADRQPREGPALDALGGIHIHQIVHITKDPADISLRALTPGVADDASSHTSDHK